MPTSRPAFNDERLDVMREAARSLEAEISGSRRPSRGTRRRRASRCASSSGALGAGERHRASGLRDAARPLVRAPARAGARRGPPNSFHVSYMRRLSPLDAIYTKERSSRSACDTLAQARLRPRGEPNIKLDLDDRPQKSPRACVIASDPPQVVHLITRAQGGLHDYQAFLHEAGHALHYAGCDPGPAVHLPQHLARPRADRDLLVHPRGDLARAGLAREHFGLSERGGRDERRGDDLPGGAALPPLHGEVPVRARVLGAVQRRRRHARRLLRAADRGDQRPLPLGRLPRGHGRGLLLGRLPARLDPRGAARARTSCARSGRDWWASSETGERLRALFAEGTKPSSEEIAARIGFDPLDTGPLVAELGG